MTESILFVYLILGPSIFGFSISLLAYWLLDLAVRKQSFPKFIQTTAQVLGWFLGNGGIVMGGIYLSGSSPISAGDSHTKLISFFGYLFGFGLGMSYRMLGFRDRSLIGTLQQYLTGQQTEAVLLMLRYEASSIEDAAKTMQIDEETFIRLYESALKEIHKRWKSLKELLQEIQNEPA